MEEFTGDEASQSNQIFPVETTPHTAVEAVAAPSNPSYAPDSHVPGSEVRIHVANGLIEHISE